MKGRFSAWRANVTAEFRKIVWPGKTEIQKNTLLVVIASIVIGCVIAIADYLFQSGFNVLFTM